LLHRDLTRRHGAHPHAGRDQERHIATRKHLADGLDHAPLLFAVFDEPREVVVEGGVDDGIGSHRALG